MFFRWGRGEEKDKTGVINDPIGQTHMHANEDRRISRYAMVYVVCLSIVRMHGRTDVQTTSVKIVIANVRDCGSASWIKRNTMSEFK